MTPDNPIYPVLKMGTRFGAYKSSSISLISMCPTSVRFVYTYHWALRLALIGISVYRLSIIIYILCI